MINIFNKLVYMRYGQRLKFARNTRELTQTQLSEQSGVSQSLISQLENSETATGSEYTNRLASALNISATWLADEKGSMELLVYQTADAKIIAAAKVMEKLPEFARDAALKNISEIAALINQVKGGENQ